MRAIFIYLVKLLIALIVVFSLHLAILNFLEKPLFENMIVLSYLINFILAAIVLLVIEKTMQKKSAQAGFIFMAGSGLKFLVFFIVFYPTYRADDKMQTIEFTTFFIPYALSLIADVIYLSKQLNNQTSS
ncbi:MAG: DUF6168 family protein [Urechidicola sp.]|nr:DUF6168 family protein [Urechidicola sp.]